MLYPKTNTKWKQSPNFLLILRNLEVNNSNINNENKKLCFKIFFIILKQLFLCSLLIRMTIPSTLVFVHFCLTRKSELSWLSNFFLLFPVIPLHWMKNYGINPNTMIVVLILWQWKITNFVIPNVCLQYFLTKSSGFMHFFTHNKLSQSFF